MRHRTEAHQTLQMQLILVDVLQSTSSAVIQVLSFTDPHCRSSSLAAYCIAATGQQNTDRSCANLAV